MNEFKNFRLTNKIEKKIIYKSFSEISPKIKSVLERDNSQLYIFFNTLTSKNRYPTIYLIPINLINELSIIKSKKDIIAAGLYFGFIKKSEFMLSLEATEFLNNQGCFSKSQILYVNEKGEKSVLYGNQILKKMILKFPNGMKKDDFILIFSNNNQLIAIAKSKVGYSNYQNLNPNDIVALNLVDKGYYLRKSQ